MQTKLSYALLILDKYFVHIYLNPGLIDFQYYLRILKPRMCMLSCCCQLIAILNYHNTYYTLSIGLIRTLRSNTFT